VNSALTVEIEDNGVGIMPEYFQKVFEPFGISSARKKGSFPGYSSTGLVLRLQKAWSSCLREPLVLKAGLMKGLSLSVFFPMYMR